MDISNSGASGSLGAGNVTDNATLTFRRSNTYTVSNVISGNGTVIQAGTGTLALNANNTFTGTMTIRRGTVLVGAATALGNATGTVSLGDNLTTTDSVSLLTNGAYTVANPITVGGNGTTGILTLGGNTDGNSTFSGAITLKRNLTVAQVATSGSNALTLSGNIAAGTSGAETLTFAGPGAIQVTGNVGNGTTGDCPVAVSVTGGTTTLSGNNTYSGTTTITSGTLQAGSGTALSSATSVSDDGTLDLNGKSISIGALNGGGNVINTSSSATLTVTGGGNFTGNITGNTTALTVGGTADVDLERQ